MWHKLTCPLLVTSLILATALSKSSYSSHAHPTPIHHPPPSATRRAKLAFFSSHLEFLDNPSWISPVRVTIDLATLASPEVYSTLLFFMLSRASEISFRFDSSCQIWSSIAEEFLSISNSIPATLSFYSFFKPRTLCFFDSKSTKNLCASRKVSLINGGCSTNFTLPVPVAQNWVLQLLPQHHYMRSEKGSLHQQGKKAFSCSAVSFHYPKWHDLIKSQYEAQQSRSPRYQDPHQDSLEQWLHWDLSLQLSA